MRKFPDYPDIQELFSSFTANFIKWRYETMFEAMTQLVPLRHFIETHFSKDLFGKVQYAETLNQCAEAAADKGFWPWMKCVFVAIVSQLERIRRRGISCACEAC